MKLERPRDGSIRVEFDVKKDNALGAQAAEPARLLEEAGVSVPAPPDHIRYEFKPPDEG